MRGGERLVDECSWMSGICSGFHHSTGKSETFSYRCPSSVFFANRFRSADCQKIQLSNFGMIATGNHNFERFAALCNTLGGSQGVEDLRLHHSTGCFRESGFAGGFYPPLQSQWETGSIHPTTLSRKRGGPTTSRPLPSVPSFCTAQIFLSCLHCVYFLLSCPQEASMSPPNVLRTVAGMPASSSVFWNSATAALLLGFKGLSST